ncbi:MAG: T9SS type A sorting domain-containing protein [Bacteroidetes bacterium]|nr:T9SS type A sorting domain-containing protein [Bacteroidota bacterium]
MKKSILLLLFTSRFFLLQAQIPADSLPGVYAGKLWNSNPLNATQWTRYNDTLRLSNIDSIHCTPSGYIQGESISFQNTDKYYTNYFSCNTLPPTNHFLKFYALDSVKWICDSMPLPPFYQSYYSKRFYGKRIRSNPSTTGIKKNTPINFLLFYPNPANRILNIEGEFFNQNEGVKIFDILGNEVLQSKQKQIDISTLPNGIYYIRYQIDANFVSTKVSVQH